MKSVTEKKARHRGVTLRMSGDDSTSGPQHDIAVVVDLVREMSRQKDPQALVSMYRRRATEFFGGDGSISLSRRGLQHPKYKVTRSTIWSEQINPWKDPHLIPLLEGGIVAELFYADEPRVIGDFKIPEDDPAYEHLQDARSLMCLPLYDEGTALNMVVRYSHEPDFFSDENLSGATLLANLFGRATHGLVLHEQVQRTYDELDREMRRVGQIQRSLLPPKLPDIPSLNIAASYETAARAGGDYYDFFELSDGRWGMIIADVSGHGPAAAVVMAILRTILHHQCPDCLEPSDVLRILNRGLIDHSEGHEVTFVTAFYARYDPKDRSLRYASAGHNPPLLVSRSLEVRELDDAQSLPLGITLIDKFIEGTVTLKSGETLILYTDGITEAFNPAGEMYGRQRLLSCVRENTRFAQEIVDCVTYKLKGFTGDETLQDDQTILALRVK